MRSAFSVPASTGGAALEGFRERAASRLLEERPDGVRWRGELSSSALSTATAACALELRRRALGADAGGGSRRLVESALDWLATHQNEDGGWGDTTDSPSNPSTTVLAWVALGLKPRSSGERSRSVERAEAWIRRRIGSLEGRELGRAIVGAYGEDRTFSVPILTMAALGGRLGDGRDAWGVVEALPFELAALPHHWLHRVGLPMVSYALPALIAIGQVRHHRRPPRNPLVRWIRDAARRRTLAVLERIQPSSGGFLEAAPLTSFVGMSLVGAGRPRHPVVERAAGFLESTVRDDGSWPIDTDLSIWLTTLAVNALAAGGRLDAHLGEGERAALLDWLLARQHLDEHPYTAAAPGGWAWTDASGGVPDADDTAGALLALWSLASKTGTGEVPDAELRERAALGVGWLLDLQNRDGGIPTFCRGWGRLPFDRSSPDLTAHALRAWHCWRRELGGELGGRVDRASARALDYLLATQRPDGAWVPLWFGNQGAERMENPVYGTSRVLLADGVGGHDDLERRWRGARLRGCRYLAAAQHDDGGWGGDPSAPASIEETGLAVEALSEAAVPGSAESAAAARGIGWLERATEGGASFPAAPIGLYFARLWYRERLYPILFATSALERARSRP